MKWNKLLGILIVLSLIHAECVNTSLADGNDDGYLDIIDVVLMVSLVLNTSDFSEINLIQNDIDTTLSPKVYLN